MKHVHNTPCRSCNAREQRYQEWRRTAPPFDEAKEIALYGRLRAQAENAATEAEARTWFERAELVHGLIEFHRTKRAREAAARVRGATWIADSII